MVEQHLLNRVRALKRTLDTVIDRLPSGPGGNRRLFDKSCICREFAETDLGIMGIVMESHEVIHKLMRELELADSGLIALVDEMEAQKEQLEVERKRVAEAAARIKKLEGLIPICSYCKKIRNDDGQWQAVERYIQEHTDASFSHGICPECLKREHGGDIA